MDTIQRSGLTWTEENDLRWYFARDYESPLGLRSSLHGQIEQLKLGRAAGEGGRAGGELSEVAYFAAQRVNRRAARLELMPPELLAVLQAAFGPHRGQGLEVWGELAPVVLCSAGAAEAHRRSRSKHPLAEWLQRLSYRVRGQKGPAKPRDARLVAELRLEAEALLFEAVQCYRQARARRAG